jgi:pimeloyl-ACP methyl ester carboxylesterase
MAMNPDVARPEPGSPESSSIRTADGVHLSTGYWPGPHEGRGGFILIPGFWGDWRRLAYRNLASELSRHGSVIAANMRGHSGSTGWFAFGAREERDASALFREARRRGFREITAVGFSLGGWALARHLAAAQGDRSLTRHLVLVCTPARVPLTPRPWKRGLFVQLRHGGRGWVRPDLRHLWSPRHLGASMAELGDLPVSLVYAEDDWMVPPEHGRELLRAARGPRAWKVVSDPRSLHAEMLALFQQGELIRAILGTPECPEDGERK